MEFFPNTIRYDATSLGPSGEDNIPTFKTFGSFEVTLEDVNKLIEGLNWIKSKVTKGDNQIESDRFVMSVVDPMKDILVTASVQMSEVMDANV